MTRADLTKKSEVLSRIVFELSREVEFFSEKELEMQIGHPKTFWRAALLKELVDNALDACETGEISPRIQVTATAEHFEVKDNGPGLPLKTIEGSLNYLLRVSDKAFYVSPTRGQMGNALKTVWAAPYVATGAGLVEIWAQGLHHTINTSLDRIAGKPRIEHRRETASHVKSGTIVRIHWPDSASTENDDFKRFFTKTPPTFEELVRAYSAFNPHASFALREIISDPKDPEKRFEVEKVFRATDAKWRKWRTDEPICAHWYTPGLLRDLVAAYVSHEQMNGNKAFTVREFVSQFRGLSSTVKQKKIIEGFSGAYLHDLIRGEDIDMKIVVRLLERMKAASSEVKPYALGLLGEEHFKRWLAEEIDEASFGYRKRAGLGADGLPYNVEMSFGIKKNKEAGRTLITGTNWTPTLAVPIKEIQEAIGHGRVDNSDPVILIIHVVKPRFEFLDRGKTRVDVE
jgi:hypothetical protein